jgi:spore germination protein GerM
VARAWVELLAAGPSDAERARGVGSEIPAATRLLGARLEAGTLTVELSEAVVAGGGSASMWGRIQQLRYSLTALPGVSSLVVEVAGAPLRVWGGEGVMVEWPWQAAGVPAASVRW